MDNNIVSMTKAPKYPDRTIVVTNVNKIGA